jgi:hypothetical protein
MRLWSERCRGGLADLSWPDPSAAEDDMSYCTTDTDRDSGFYATGLP